MSSPRTRLRPRVAARVRSSLTTTTERPPNHRPIASAFPHSVIYLGMRILLQPRLHSGLGKGEWHPRQTSGLSLRHAQAWAPPRPVTHARSSSLLIGSRITRPRKSSLLQGCCLRCDFGRTTIRRPRRASGGTKCSAGDARAGLENGPVCGRYLSRFLRNDGSRKGGVSARTVRALNQALPRCLRVHARNDIIVVRPAQKSR
ncbi:hypothetical protein BD414DRAFT_32088 [Trametes punicea]|nr:hypothetical protein BD414DRAFT_32088 [Trametes punicea]